MSANTLKMLTTDSPIARLNGLVGLEDAVDAEADGHFLLGRLQMDVGRALFEGVVDHLQGGLVAARILGAAHAVGVFFAAAGALAHKADGDFSFPPSSAWLLELQPEPAAAEVAQVPRRQDAAIRFEAFVADADVHQAGAEIEEEQHGERQQEHRRREEPNDEQAEEAAAQEDGVPEGGRQFELTGVAVHPPAGAHPAEVDRDDGEERGNVKVEAGAARKVLAAKKGRPDRDTKTKRKHVLPLVHLSWSSLCLCALKLDTDYRMPGADTLMPLNAIFNCSGLGATSKADALSMSPRSTSCRRFSVKSTMPSR